MKYNRRISATPVENHKDATVNEEGGLAFKMSPKMELYNRASTAMIREPKFYDKEGKGDDEISKLVGIVAKEDPEYILKLAAYCRNELYLRSLPVKLLVEATNFPESKKYVRSYAQDVIKRPDELTEVVACWHSIHGDIGNKAKKGMLCASLKKGIADSFHNFNEYQLAKYDRDGAVKLRDVMCICHPKPKGRAEKTLFKKVMNRELSIPETWETYISGNGSTSENWEHILPKMGFMARIRNIRNFLEKGVDIAPIIDMLNDKNAVANSKQFPYRFFSAYREVEGIAKSRKVLDALETAMDLSIENIPEFRGTTFITTDNSGSMTSTVSEKSKIQMKEIGNMLGAMANKLCDDAIVSVFGDEFAVVNILPSNGIINNCQKLCNTNVGCSTNAWLSIQYLLDNKIKVDRILIFSDCQCYNSQVDDGGLFGGYYGRNNHNETLASLIKKYRNTINKNVYVYSFDLSGYGTSQFPEDDPNTCLIGGWSEKVLSFIPMFEQGKNAIDHIDTITPGKYSKKEEDAE